MATKTITVRVDEDVKEKAEVILDDIGLTVTVLFNACLKALVREKRVPFSLVSSEYEQQQEAKAKSEELQVMSGDPQAKGYAQVEISNPSREKCEGFGKLAHRANPSLWDQEEGAWERAVVESYDNN